MADAETWGPRRRLVWLSLGGIVVVAALVLGILALVVPTGQPTVGVVGDSISALSKPTVMRTLGADYRVEYSAQFGATMAMMHAPLKEIAGGHPHALIVELGTNNALLRQDREHWQAELREEISTVEHLRCVLLVTVGETVSGAWNRQAAGLNREMKLVAGRRSRHPPRRPGPPQRPGAGGAGRALPPIGEARLLSSPVPSRR